MQRPSEAPQTPPPTARLLVNVFDKVSGNLLVTFSQNASSEGENKWEELNIGLTAKADVQVEVICENTDKDNRPVFFDNLSVKVQAVPTVLVVQENHYYPFGLGMKGLDWVLPSGKEDKYSYNGKEKQTDFDLGWSDYGARQYDPQCGCFRSIDPHAEKYTPISPYVYVANNPINATDPSGKEIVPVGLNATHSSIYQKALSTKSFQSSFKGLIESKYHIVKLYSSPLYVSAGKAEYGKTTYHITEMGYPKPLQTSAYFTNAEKVANEEPFKSKYSDNHAQVKLNNNLDDVGISDLAAAGTLFHEVWHTKMSMNGTGGKDNDSQHNGMTLDSYFQEKMSFMTEFAGRELTQNEQVFHQWHGLAGTVEYAEQFMNKVTDSNGNVRYEGYNEKGKAYLNSISKVNDRTGIENQ